jgi:hypothetical protein
MTKKKIKFVLYGCDDATYIPLEVTPDQLEFLKLIEKKSKECFTYGCMPIAEIKS